VAERDGSSLMDRTVRDFLAELASDSPAPGGGSVAALAGAVAASLAAMVGRLTVDREEFREHEAEVKAALTRADQLREELLELVEEDTRAFQRVMAAFRLPKGTPAEREARRSAVQSAFKEAAEVPLRTAELCLQGLRLARLMAEHGNPNASSDAGVAALMAAAGARAAALNVRINLDSIRDAEAKEDLAARIDAVIAEVEELERTAEAGESPSP